VIRVVKMNFREDQLDDFFAVFNESCAHIRAFDGCTYLELWQTQDDPRIVFTHSHWESPAHLENYRHSELFKSTWAKTKILFDDKPEAWSIDSKKVLD